MVTTARKLRQRRIEGRILAVVMVVCAIVLGSFGWAVVLIHRPMGWLLVLAAGLSAFIAYGEWTWA